MFEVDVDVRGFVASAADEAFEQNVDLGGVNGRYTEAITHDGVRCGTASLAEDLPITSKPDEVPDRKEVRFVAQVFNEFELMQNEFANSIGNAVRVPFACSFPCELLQIIQRRDAGRAELFRVFVTKFIE